MHHLELLMKSIKVWIKNEQMAHRYLVHTAQNSKSQYFLVTPKLLTGLYYHPDMVVHCILQDHISLITRRNVIIVWVC